MKTKLFDNQRITKNLYVFNIVSLSGHLGNYRLLRLDYEDKNCLEQKTAEKTIFVI